MSLTDVLAQLEPYTPDPDLRALLQMAFDPETQRPDKELFQYRRGVYTLDMDPALYLIQGNIAGRPATILLYYVEQKRVAVRHSAEFFLRAQFPLSIRRTVLEFLHDRGVQIVHSDYFQYEATLP